MRAPRPAPAVLAQPPRTRGEWMALYKHCRFATRADNQALLTLSAIPMQSGSTSIRYERGTDYFAAAHESGVLPLVIALTQPDGTVAGTTSLIIRNGQRHGRATTYGFFSDLRTGTRMHRATWLELARCYAESVRYVPGIAEVHNPRFFLTTVIDANERALRLFRDRLPGLVYQPLQPYEVVHALFRFLPTAAHPGLTVRRAGAKDAGAVRAFLATHHAGAGLGEGIANPGDDELARRLREWADFSWASFWLAYDRHGRLVGTVAPRRTPHRRPVLTGFTALERWATRLTAPLGGRGLQDDQPLDILYLSHFAVARSLPTDTQQAIARALLGTVERDDPRRRGAHAIAWVEWPRFAATAVPTRGFACVRTRGTLYQVLLREHLGDRQRDLSTDPWEQPPILDASIF